jgi:hypothetical protein
MQSVEDKLKAFTETAVAMGASAKIVLCSILPCEDKQINKCSQAINSVMQKLADGRKIIYADSNSLFAARQGSMQGLHPNPRSIGLLASAIKATLGIQTPRVTREQWPYKRPQSREVENRSNSRRPAHNTISEGQGVKQHNLRQPYHQTQEANDMQGQGVTPKVDLTKLNSRQGDINIQAAPAHLPTLNPRQVDTNFQALRTPPLPQVVAQAPVPVQQSPLPTQMMQMYPYPWMGPGYQAPMHSMYIHNPQIPHSMPSQPQHQYWGYNVM